MHQATPTHDDTPRNQTVESIRRLIVSLGLKPGAALPIYTDLAVQFRVSRVTVKRAMDVLAAAGVVRRLHGKGVYLAKRIARRPSDLSRVGVIGTSRLNLFKYPYLREIMSGIVLLCEHESYDLSLYSLRDFATTTRPEEVTSAMDGVILLGEIDETYIRNFCGLDVPVVVVDYRTEVAPFDCLVCDNRAATQAVLDHLCALGHRRIAFLAAANRPTPTMRRRFVAPSLDKPERREAYREAMAARHLPAQEVSSVEEILAALRAPARSRPTAVLAADVMEAAACLAPLAAAGVRVPADLSMAGAAGCSEDPPWEGKFITSACVHFQEMGQEAVRLLQRRSGGTRLTAPRLVRIGASLFPGATAARVPSGR